jgi:protein O-GlcNAc transferase
MYDKSFLDNINKLFLKKKFNEVILNIEENNHFLENYPDLFNVSGVSKILKLNYNKSDVISALNDFENYFLKSKTNNKKIEAVCNFIATCVVNSQKYGEITSYFEKAKKLFEKCEEQVGYNEKLFISGVDLYKHLLDHNKNRKLLKELINNNSDNKVIACAYGYMSNYAYDWGLKEYYEYSKKFKDFFSKYKVKNINEINYKENKKIRVGFVSKDFISNHSVTWLTKNTLLHFDKNKFETYGITLTDDSLIKDSSLELKNNFEKWLNLSKLNNQEVINILQDQKIEILVDLLGLFHADRIEIFNSRISPLQVSWLGYPNTVGFSNIDYLISDKNLIKNDEEKFYSEKILKLSNIWNCHSGFKFNRELFETPAKSNKYITFGSFNNFLKISNEVVEVWSNILKNVKNSKLILRSSLNVNNDSIFEKFKKYDVHNSIEFFGKQDVEDHLKLYKEIDIALDTFPYNGVVTTFEALWSGVPVIVMKGFNMNSRCGESILKNGKIDFLISQNKEDYVKKALFYSENITKLEELRLKIHKNILKTLLFNSKKFSIDFQNKLLSVYNKTI